ncbi:acyl-CoA dehydrogenase family protein [Solwaraspora sp. WMMD1047]|uniref:acyl-CoA dehydrogenase family protein n=1 Tax=Solwaraspora sp. WMMD1047 TaxID=3016102 RepID=UPI00241748D7|nr:acyl-CoA dehydrogenase family protein [Solwaraspora sp. WMMD1047]MDG4834372.1 acyl-CoA dehydrogenase family protein [Solwaraspora sp. WMMD1047]
MALDVEYDEEQRAFVAAIRTLGERCRTEWVSPSAADGFPTRTWSELADIGCFALAETSGAAVELVAVLEELGRLGCPGPLWETVLAVRALDAELVAGVAELAGDGAVDGELVDGVVAGTRVATVASGGLVPWAGRAAVILERAPDGVWLCEARPTGVPVTVLTSQTWTAARPRRLARVAADRARAATDLAELALAAYLVGACGRIVAEAAGYAAARRQFGRPLGDLQGVAFPLAECDVGVAAARAVTRRAAADLATGTPVPAGMPLLSAARAARGVVSTGFQTYGALAFTEESSVAPAARMITQLVVAGLPPWRRDACQAEVLRPDRPDRLES